MAGWDDIIKELGETISPVDQMRKKYLGELSDYTGRNTIAYYSSFLDKPGAINTDINDSDMTGYMNAIRGLDCSKGLDLILHTPGGDPSAAEALVKYLRKKFGEDIRVIVPQIAMSAGTMLACASKSIVMGNQSSLGPVDPQFNGIPAYNIEQEFIEAKEDLAEHPENATYWMIKLQQYPAAFMKTALDAISLSSELVREWLSTCMYSEKDEDIVNTIVESLNEHDNSKIHGRHYDKDFCKSIGLKIEDMEKDNIFQDLILSVHHSFMITLNRTDTVKIIENQEGKAYISHRR